MTYLSSPFEFVLWKLAFKQYKWNGAEYSIDDEEVVEWFLMVSDEPFLKEKHHDRANSRKWEHYSKDYCSLITVDFLEDVWNKREVASLTEHYHGNVEGI